MRRLTTVALTLLASVALANNEAVSTQDEQYAEATTATASEDETVGSWTDDRIGGKLTILLRDGKPVLRSSYSDGSSGESELVSSKTSKGVRYETDNGIGEYFVVNPNGKLEFWSASGNYYTAEPTL